MIRSLFALLLTALGLAMPARAEVGAIVVAEDAVVSWGAAVRPAQEEAVAAARALCEERLIDGAGTCGRTRLIREDRCFAIAVDLPLRRALGTADDTNLRMAKVKAAHACQRRGGLTCALQHVECVPKAGE